MTLHKLHAGDGYTYLTRQVAAGDEGRSPGQNLVEYYTASGNPPGRWMGAGAADLAVEGRVREDQMRSLFGKGMHPDAEQIIEFERLAGRSDDDARSAAKLGRAFPAYKPLPPRADRIAARLKAMEAESGHPPSKTIRSKIEAQEARRDRRAVAGYDLVFTPVKSASLLWALGSATAREHVEAAHHEAVTDTLAWLERETAFARIGDRGEAQVETRGFLAAAFDHRDSRTGDPDLHTHVAISNKVRARQHYPNGGPRWLSLDARVIHAAAVAASERYNTRFEEMLTRRLGVQFADRADSIRAEKRVVREITGVPQQLIKHFSKRRAAIESRYADLTTDYRQRHGHEPSREAQLKLAQQATLETRAGKEPPTTLAEKITAWREDAASIVSTSDLARLTEESTGRDVSYSGVVDLPIDELAARVLDVVSEERSTWTRWNVIAEAERQLRGYRFATPSERETATEALVTRILEPELSLRLTPEELALTVEPSLPALAVGQRRSNGESVYMQHGAGRYTVQVLLDAETRLLDLATQATRYGIDPETTGALIADFEHRYGVQLDEGQRGLVLGFAADPRRLVVGIGPAGAGKTTAMRAVAHAWQQQGRRVVALAPSAAAADVLGAELGCRAENLHKFQHTHQNGAPDDDWFVLRPGDLVLVDEAGMAGTRRLDWITQYARERGALVRLLGDPAQMSSVEAGGSLRLLIGDTGAYELSDLHRFKDPAEAAATLLLRNGDRTALEYYFDNDRVASGGRAAVFEEAYAAWDRDSSSGVQSLLVAHSARDVSVLNRRARANRVRNGDVQVQGVQLHDGNLAGVGDLIVTRANDRRLPVARGRFVKNGDRWQVVGEEKARGLRVRHVETGGVVTLPESYVASSVELGYAVTATSAQGMTVDTAHVIADERTTREALYVAVTRGRSRNTIYLAAEEQIDLEAERPPAPAADERDLLVGILQRETAERSATEVQRMSLASAKTPVRPAPSPAPPANVRAPQRRATARTM